MNFFSLASGKISSVPTFVLQGFRRRKETEKRVNKIFKHNAGKFRMPTKEREA